ncbi:MAG: SpoIIE family protein phosphatase [Crocinitomicaceae bacterium]
MRNTLFCLFILLLSFNSSAQRTPDYLIIRGTVMGYEYDPSVGLFKKDKVQIKGIVDKVLIEATVNAKKITSTKSSSSGDFGLSLKIGERYHIQYSKSGYGKSSLDIDLTNIPKDIAKGGLLLKNIELLLNHFQSDKAIDQGKTLGLVKYNVSQKQFEFNRQVYGKKERMFKNDEDNAAKNLLENSVESNSGNNNTPYNHDSPEVVTNEDTTSTEAIMDKGEKLIIPKLPTSQHSPLSKIENWSSITKDDIDARAQEIQSAWEQLEKDKLIAVTPEDFLIIQAREELLKSAEKELEAAKAFIDEQDKKIAAQNWFNIALIIGLLALGAFVFILFKRNKEKKEANKILADKNKKITDSINYAERIQRSILLSDAKIKSIFPNSFIYHKPLAIVSGDFYWFSEVNGKKIFAAVDCTGHGVPGAFMSLIANTLLNQIVNEQKITSTGKILNELNEGIREALHQSSEDYFSQDGMDMSICSFDAQSNELTFSGAMNHGFLMQQGELKELEADIIGIGGMMRPKRLKDFKFQETKVKLSPGDMIYLFSDGFMDQFGGPENKKFNVKNFKELLQEASGLNPDEQIKIIDKRFKSWKGTTPQIDDVLIVGVQV